MGESSTKPYLIRALHEWCTDNGYTPYIVVQVDANTFVPMAHVQDGQITLNVGTLATQNLLLGNEFVEFQARFNGKTETVSVHIGAISAIYARETGAGMGFEVQALESAEISDPPATSTSVAESADAGELHAVHFPERSSNKSTDDSTGDSTENAPENTDDGTETDPEPENKRPKLTIVK